MAVLTAPRSPHKSRTPTVRTTAWRQDPEVRLMLRVRDGDAAAFTELERIYRTRVLGWFCRRLGDRKEAEDLTQEVFLRLYRSRRSYEPRGPFRHLGVSHHTERGPQRPAVAPAASLGASGSSGDRAGRGARRCCPTGLSRLRGRWSATSWPASCGPPWPGLAGRQRAAVELHQFDDRTYTEVAAELDMTPKAAKSLLYRARNQLRVVLATFVQ